LQRQPRLQAKTPVARDPDRLRPILDHPSERTRPDHERRVFSQLEDAKLAERILRERLDRLGLKFEHILSEFVGATATHGRLAGDQHDAPEVQLRFGVRGPDRAAVERFTREIAPLVLNGPPSVTGFAGGRPKVEEIVAYWPALIDKAVVKTRVDIIQ